MQHVGTAQQAWRRIESYRPAAQISDRLGIAGAFLLVRADRAEVPTEGLPTPDQLTSHLYTLDAGPAELVGALFPHQRTAQLSALLRAADQLDADQGAETACEHLHRQYVTSARWMPGLAGPPDVVAEVMLTLAGSGALTFDFTTGTGSLLRMATDRALHNGTTRCYAQENNAGVRADHSATPVVRAPTRPTRRTHITAARGTRR
ncbi:hypothetical protein O7628_18670 [Micromonospora sp. WMMD956]|nr:hypothetical protein [Micromonospora sp. WMMD956]MDG4817516.1 hypothetical protein [Micromonospora sp. WMMD956]